MTPPQSHLHVVPEQPAQVPVPISSEQVRELRAVGEKFGVPLVDPIDYRTVELNAAHVGCVEEAAAELRRQGFLLLPSMLDRVAARWHDALPGAGAA